MLRKYNKINGSTCRIISNLNKFDSLILPNVRRNCDYVFNLFDLLYPAIFRQLFTTIKKGVY